MLNHFWQIAKPAPKEFFKQFPELNTLVLQLLYNRGLITQEQIDEFLNPDYGQDIHDPFLFLEMEKATGLILQAVENSEKILVYGDYDADGVCASVILVETLKEFGANCEVYLPFRETEGYGLNTDAAKEIVEKGFKLVITVDCGIGNNKEIDLLMRSGVKVIISDHHQPPEVLPKASSILNPKVKNETYPFRELAGCGVAYKLIQGLITQQKKHQVNQLPEGFEKWLLDLVAIGTIADLSPLLGENRTLVKYGLIVLQKTKRLGLRELAKVAASQFNDLDENSVGFQIAPRLNAAGRMNHASAAYQLLIAKNQKEAATLAENLNKTNQERQRLTDKILEEAKSQIGQKPKEKILFAKGLDWSIGVVGLVAGKITDEFHRPCLIITKNQKGLVGSGRSIKDFNIIEALKQCRKYLLKFGGHSQACGFTLKEKNFLKFKKAMEKITEQMITKKEILPVLEIERLVNLEDINWDFFENLKLFRPFGQNNHKPRFCAQGVAITSTEILGNNNQHLRLMVKHQNFSFDPRPALAGLPKQPTPAIRKIIGFCLGENNKGNINWCQTLKAGDKIDFVFEVDENIWNGRRELQIKIVDLKLSKYPATISNRLF